MPLADRFPDLASRVASAAVMIALGAAAIWVGGVVFRALVVVAVAAMIWELHRMLAPGSDRRLAAALGAAGGALIGLLALAVPDWALVLAAALGAATATLTVPAAARARFGVGAAVILVAGAGFILLREGYGMLWLLWLVALVIGSDVAGYFAGRVIGGPKFWPRVSPKKTWSGTVAGWLVAVAIGAAFAAPLGAGPGLVVLSVLVAMAGQAGDIGESAIKRGAGVKDSSALIPGHGGVMDRFDAMLGGALAVLILHQLDLLAGV